MEHFFVAVTLSMKVVTKCLWGCDDAFRS